MVLVARGESRNQFGGNIFHVGPQNPVTFIAPLGILLVLISIFLPFETIEQVASPTVEDTGHTMSTTRLYQTLEGTIIGIIGIMGLILLWRSNEGSTLISLLLSIVILVLSISIYLTSNPVSYSNAIYTLSRRYGPASNVLFIGALTWCIGTLHVLQYLRDHESSLKRT